MTEPFGDWIRDSDVEIGALKWFTALTPERQADALTEAFNLAAQMHEGLMEADRELRERARQQAIFDAEEFQEKYSHA